MEIPYMDPIYIAFGIFLLATAYNYLKPKQSRNYTSLNVDEAEEKIKEDENILIIDVRNRDEFNVEHIRRAKNIPLDQLEKRMGKLPRDKDILVYCQTGARSVRAVRKLEVAGFTRLYHMHQGLRGWNSAGYPTTKSRGST
jgi:rhodanese-related sulfurtransferase